MSATVFTFLRVQHLFFEGKKNMVKHLIIKIRRIYFKICLKTSTCFMIDENKRKKANYSIHNVLPGIPYMRITVFCIACLLQKSLYFDIYQVFSLQTSQINQFWIFFFFFFFFFP